MLAKSHLHLFLLALLPSFGTKRCLKIFHRLSEVSRANQDPCHFRCYRRIVIQRLLQSYLKERKLPIKL